HRRGRLLPARPRRPSARRTLARGRAQLPELPTAGTTSLLRARLPRVSAERRGDQGARAEAVRGRPQGCRESMGRSVMANRMAIAMSNRMANLWQNDAPNPKPNPSYYLGEPFHHVVTYVTREASLIAGSRRATP